MGGPSDRKGNKGKGKKGKGKGKSSNGCYSDSDDDGPIGRQAVELNGPPMPPVWRRGPQIQAAAEEEEVSSCEDGARADHAGTRTAEEEQVTRQSSEHGPPPTADETEEPLFEKIPANATARRAPRSLDDLDAETYLRQVMYEREFLCDRTVVASDQTIQTYKQIEHFIRTKKSEKKTEKINQHIVEPDVGPSSSAPNINEERRGRGAAAKKKKSGHNGRGVGYWWSLYQEEEDSAALRFEIADGAAARAIAGFKSLQVQREDRVSRAGGVVCSPGTDVDADEDMMGGTIVAGSGGADEGLLQRLDEAAEGRGVVRGEDAEGRFLVALDGATPQAVADCFARSVGHFETAVEQQQFSGAEETEVGEARAPMEDSPDSRVGASMVWIFRTQRESISSISHLMWAC